MKYILTIIAVLIFFASFGQTYEVTKKDSVLFTPTSASGARGFFQGRWRTDTLTVMPKDTLWHPVYAGTIQPYQDNLFLWNGTAWVLLGGSGVAITASNGLTLAANDVKLGGTLIQETSINTSAYTLTLTGASSNTLQATNTLGNAIRGNANGSSAIVGTSVGNTGVGGISTSGAGVAGTSTSGYGATATVTPASSGTVASVFQVSNQSSLFGSIGSGASIDYFLRSSNTGNVVSNKLVSVWTSPNSATKSSDFYINGFSSGTENTIATFSGNGLTKLNQYTLGNFYQNDTASYKPMVVDASGNLYRSSWLGGGGGGGVENYITLETPSGTVNGVNVTFTLALTPVTNTETISINGLIQYRTDDYTITDDTITFTTAPFTGDKIRVTYFKE